MQMLTTAAKLDWSSWLLGIFGALVSGGAGAVAGMLGVIAVNASDPDHAALNLSHLLESAGISFAVCGIFSLAKYLQLHPVPSSAAPEPPKQQPGA